MTGTSASVIGWAVAMSTAGLDKGAPRVKVLQVRTTRTQKRDTRNPRTNIVKTKTKICPVHGVAKRSTHLRRQKGHTTNECVQLRQLIDKLVKEGRLDHLVKNIKEGKDKQRSGGKKDAPRDKAERRQERRT
ncbi:hypothetical protein Tco_0517456 [Tanacetum coccineum]